MKKDRWVKKANFIIVMLSAFSLCVPAFSEVLDKVIVVVNDEVVTQREFDRQFSVIKNRYEQNLKGKELDERLEEARKMFLEQIIDSKIAISEAKKKNVKIDEAALQDKIEKIRAHYATEEEFLKALSAQGTNLTEFEREIRDRMLAQKIIEKEVASKINITPGDVRDLYEKNKEKLVAPPRAKVSTIMIRKTGDPADDRKRLSVVQDKLKKGRVFTELAKELSEGPYASEGGEMGYIAPGQTIEIIDETIFSMKKGEVSKPIETEIGYHILKVEDTTEPKKLELAEVNDFLRAQLFNKRFTDELSEWLKEKRKNAYISYK